MEASFRFIFSPFQFRNIGESGEKIAETNHILTESGDKIITENGDRIVWE